jgi:hypothetical protein
MGMRCILRWSGAVDDAVVDGELSEEGDGDDGDEEGDDEDGEVAVQDLEPGLGGFASQADDSHELLLAGGEGFDLVAELLDAIGDAGGTTALAASAAAEVAGPMGGKAVIV